MDLETIQKTVDAGEKVVLPTGLTLRLTAGLTYREVPSTNVVGYIAGLDVESRGERILLVANFSEHPPGGGRVGMGADENASGVAVMLETARLIQESGLVPKRTIVFAALDEEGGNRFVNFSPLPTRSSDVWTAIVLHGVAAGKEHLSRQEAGAGLARAFDDSARRLGVYTNDLDDWRFFFVSGDSRFSRGGPNAHKSYLAVAVSRQGDEFSGTPNDTLEHLDPRHLLEAGQSVAHLVMVLSSR